METAGTINAVKKISGAAAAAAGRIKKLSAPLMKVLTFSPASEAIAPATVLSAYISKGRLDVIYAARSFAKYNVRAGKTYRFSDESLPSPDEVASKLAIAMKDFGVRRTDVQIVIPKSWVAMKADTMPATVLENLSDVVRFELDRLTPFSADEAHYDYTIGVQEGEKVDLFIAAAKAAAINSYGESLLERGISVKSVTFDMSGLATLCRFVSGMDTFIFAEIDRVGVKCGIVEDGLLKTSSSQDFRCDDDVLMAVIAEDYLGEQKNAAGDSAKAGPIILFFDDEAESLEDLLRSRGNLSFETLNGIDKKISGDVDLEGTRAVAAGGALEQLWPRSQGYNLLSKGVRDRDRRPFLLTGILVVALLVCLAGLRLASVQTSSERLDEISRQINIRKAEVQDVEKIKSEIEGINKRLALVNSYKHAKPLYIDLIKELTVIVPKNVWLTRVRIAGSQANIEGYAPSATSLVQILEASKYFEKVEFASPTFRDARLNMDRFQIKMEITGSKSAESADEKK